MDLTAPARWSSEGPEPLRDGVAEAPEPHPDTGHPGTRGGRARSPESGTAPATAAASDAPFSRTDGGFPEEAAASGSAESASAGSPEATARGSREAAAGAPRRLSFREWVKDHDESWVFVVIYLGLAVGLSVFVSLFWLVAVAGLHLLFEVMRQAHYRDGKANVFMHALWEIKLDVGLVLLALMLVLYIEVVLGLLGVQSAARAAAVTRAGARLGSRAAAWERNIRTFLLTVDEMVRIVYAGVMLRKRGHGPEEEAEAALHDRQGADDGVEAQLEAAAREAEKAAERRRKAQKAAAKKQKAEEAMAKRQAESERKAAARADMAAEDGVASRALSAWRARWGIADRIGVALVVVGILLIVAAPYLTPHDWGTATAALLGELRPFP